MPTAPKIVIDTNVLVSALRSRLGWSFALLSQLGQGRCQPVVTVPLVMEYEDVLLRPAMVPLAPAAVHDILDFFCATAVRQPVHFLWRPQLTDVKDDILLFATDSAAAGSTIEGFFGNIDKTRRQGLEFSAQLFLTGGHSLYANYAYTRATFQSGADIFSIREDFGGSNDVSPGDQLPLVPSHQVKLGGSFQLPRGFFAGVDGRYIGTQWLRGDEANVEPKLSSYFVTDARIGWRGRGWEVVAVGNNLFQHSYAAFGTFNVNQGGGNVLERFVTPGMRRVVRLVIRRSFGGGDD